MAAQKLLKTLGVNDDLKEKLKTMRLHRVFKELVVSTKCEELVKFVDERKVPLIQLLVKDNRDEEETENLVDAFLLLDYLTKQLTDVSEIKSRNGDDSDDDGDMPLQSELKSADVSGASRVASKPRTPRCEPCKIYWHTKDHRGKQVPLVKGKTTATIFYS